MCSAEADVQGGKMKVIVPFLVLGWAVYAIPQFVKFLVPFIVLSLFCDWVEAPTKKISGFTKR
jgi:hypothetical protein